MSHKMLEHQGTTKALELLHMDLMGPMQVESIGGKRYVFVLVDDFTRFTWIKFIREKSDTFEVFKELCTQLQREKDSVIIRVRVIMVKNLKIRSLLTFAHLKGSNMNFHPL